MGYQKSDHVYDKGLVGIQWGKNLPKADQENFLLPA